MREDSTIERPAKKISMTDGDAESEPAVQAPAEAEAAEGAATVEDAPAVGPSTEEKPDEE